MKKTKPTVSVVITTRNRRNFLEETLHSVMNQSYTNWEIVIVDDASEDNTWEWLGSLTEPRLRLLQNTEWSERSRSRNLGLAVARGKYVLFLVDDDLLPKNALKIHINAHQDYSEAIASIGGYRTFPKKRWRNQKIINKNTLQNI